MPVYTPSAPESLIFCASAVKSFCVCGTSVVLYTTFSPFLDFLTALSIWSMNVALLATLVLTSAIFFAPSSFMTSAVRVTYTFAGSGVVLFRHPNMFG